MAWGKPCDQKRSYPTEAAALRMVRRMRRFLSDTVWLGAYHCERHACWHVGNRRPRHEAPLSDIELADRRRAAEKGNHR